MPHNAAMGVREIRQHCALDDAGERLLEQAMPHYGLSAWAHDRIRKVARTIAIGVEHLSEARQLLSRSTAPKPLASMRSILVKQLLDGLAVTRHAQRQHQ